MQYPVAGAIENTLLLTSWMVKKLADSSNKTRITHACFAITAVLNFPLVSGLLNSESPVSSMLSGTLSSSLSLSSLGTTGRMIAFLTSSLASLR
ncbi:hypothetical protein D3C78_1300200 [compost metagenome]